LNIKSQGQASKNSLSLIFVILLYTALKILHEDVRKLIKTKHKTLLLLKATTTHGMSQLSHVVINNQYFAYSAPDQKQFFGL